MTARDSGQTPISMCVCRPLPTRTAPASIRWCCWTKRIATFNPSGRSRPSAELLGHDGYHVVPNGRLYDLEVLKAADVVVIANALGPEDHEARPAFTPEEHSGGSLFLIADHAPFGAAASRLAAQFGVTLHLRYARDDHFHDGWDNERLVFSRAHGLLAQDVLTDGRSAAERVDRGVTFTGQSLTATEDALPLLRLSDDAYDWESRQPLSGQGTYAGARAQRRGRTCRCVRGGCTLSGRRSIRWDRSSA